MKAILADTTPLYGAIDTSDQYHLRAQAELARIATEKLSVIIPFPVYLENYSLVLYRLGFSQAIRFTESCLESASLINPTPDQYLKAVEKVRHFPDQMITLVDASTAILSEQLKIPVWTYDYHFDVMSVPVWR